MSQKVKISQQKQATDLAAELIARQINALPWDERRKVIADILDLLEKWVAAQMRIAEVNERQAEALAREHPERRPRRLYVRDDQVVGSKEGL